MEAQKYQINFDNSDWSGMRDLMDKYGNSDHPYFSENEDGECMMISVFKDHINTTTYQKNRWIRVNTYWRDFTVEESFKGRW